MELALLAAVLGIGTQAAPIEVHDAGGTIWLQAVSDSAIRVRISRGNLPEQRVPVMLGGGIRFRHIDIRSNEERFETGRIASIVDSKTDLVRFTTLDGKPITGETSRRVVGGIGGRFSLDSDEGIYGLGQHTDGYLDHRGTLTTLEQQNREIAIPFMVSSKGYGVLWNNASHTTVGVGFSEAPVPMKAFGDDSGQAGGLTGHYFKGQNFEAPVGDRRDSNIDFLWTKHAPEGLPLTNYSVRWTGTFTAPETAEYSFKTVADDGARLYIDDQPVIYDWSVHPAATDVGSVKLAKGSRHKIRLEFFQAGGDSLIKLSCAIHKPTDTVDWASDAGDGIDYTVFYGPSLDKVMQEYRHATGEAPMPPKWALGYWQSKERYSSQQEWMDIAAEYRRRNHPIDGFVQDWFYWDPAPWGSHEFDPKRYPDPAAGIHELHDKYNLHLMISVWGKFNPGSPDNPDRNYQPMLDKGFLYPAAVSGDRYYDAFNPAARKLYWSLMRDQIFSKGVDAWWLDASEPEVNMEEFRKAPTAAGFGAQVLNGWPLMHTTGVSQGQLHDAPNKRVFILTRSAFAGQQRTGAACWSGDITASWKTLADQIPAGLNFCLSGIPYWTTDIGAFFVPHDRFPQGASDPAYRELFTRWFEYGAFCPIFRVHGTDFAKEMWRFGPETEKILDNYDRLRYRLMPYIYSQAARVTGHGGTMMRALVMDFPDDSVARELRDEFMFGPSLLICPITEPGMSTKRVYLPKGADWYDFWTGARFHGGQSIDTPCPIDKMPIFAKAGSIVPMGPDIQYVDQRPADQIEVLIYPGRDASFDLYEDDGIDNGYRVGRSATIPLIWSQKKRTLTIDNRVGSFPGMLRRRTFKTSDRETIAYSGKRVSYRVP